MEVSEYKNVFDFLNHYKIENNEKAHTHVSFTGGKYHIPLDKNNTFLELYHKHITTHNQLKEGVKKIYLGECILPGKLFNFMVDIEIRKDIRPNISDEKLENNIVPFLISALINILKKKFPNTGIINYILSSRAPYLIHINFPQIQTSIKNAKKIMESVADIMKKEYPDIVWEKALDTNIYAYGKGLRMLGSCSKKDIEKGEFPVYRPLLNGEYTEIDLEYLKQTVIRTEIEDPEINNIEYDSDYVEREEEIDNYDDTIRNYIEEIKVNFKNNPLNIQKIKKYYKVSSNIPYFRIELKDKWCPFVQREHKRKSNPLYLFINNYGTYLKCWDDDCKNHKFPETFIRLNNQMKDVHYNNTYCPVLKEEIIPFYIELTDEIKEYIEACFSFTHYDIARFCFYLYKNKFRVDDFGSRASWYEFKNNRFYPESNHLGILISEEMVWYFLKYKMQVCEGKNENIDKLVNKLKTLNFKNNVLSEAANLFFHEFPDFVEKMNSQLNLICFSNGVLDTDTLEFRPGKVEDYITITTKQPYIEYDSSIPEIQEIYNFFNQLFLSEDVREYQLKKIAQCLSGKTQENFNIWTGNGCHAKGTEIMLYDNSTKKVEDIEVGDKLMGDDGTERNVLELFRGYSDMYKITPIRGDPFIVNGEHILSLKNENKKIINITVNNYLKNIHNLQSFYLYRANFPLKNKNYTLLSFRVERVQDDYFYGFELDKNHLYLGSDYMVYHNSNGKSKLCFLIQKAFGDYWNEMPVALITKQRNNSGNSSPEIMDLKGRRIVTIQEPETKDKLNMGIIKQFTGGDSISARQLYKKQEKFILQCKLFLCCNFIPGIECSDGGTWRRIKVIEFKSKFVDNPKPDRDNEFKRDYDLDKKLIKWAPYFLSILVHYYKKLQTEGIKEPEEVRQFTNEFRRDSDIFTQFVEQCLEEDKKICTPFMDIFNKFNFWCEEKSITDKKYKATEVKKLIGDIFGRERDIIIGNKSATGFNIRIKCEKEECLLND